jgi:hypothetical protein
MIPVAFWFGGIAAAGAAPEVVVAMRYLQVEGVSHAHLYLYKEGGTFLRQLTDDNAGQDRDPIFAPNGETIVFTRELGKAMQTWSIEPHGGGLHRLPAAPGWYTATKTSPIFTEEDPQPVPGARNVSPADSTNGEFGARDLRFKAPDGSVELILKELKSDEEDQLNLSGHGKHYRVRDLKTGVEVEMGKLPGFLGVVDLLHESRDPARHFLLEPPLRVAFLDLHLGSTGGDTCFALDLARMRLVRLSSNWAAPVPLPGEPAFLAMNYERYVPIPESPKVANSSYLEIWNADLQKIRYAHEGAALCYGASMYRPGKKPAVITLRKEEGE